uniref:Attachment surface glycoprotein n=1 Tax=human metapneumovirus TaxID=162145 RepID=U3PE62_9MONO|nr:attachment surface glycoprotein [Human metapneumovirus]
MEVRVENIRAIDMFKAKMKNRIRSSKCYRNATLILIGLSALSMALNIFLIIDYAKSKNMTKVEHCVNMLSVEPSKKTPMTSAVDLNTKPNPQRATQLTTEDSTSLAATLEGHLHTGTTPTPDATVSQQTTDEHITLLRSTNRQTTQTTAEKKPTRTTTKKETTTRTTSTAASQTLNTTNQTSNGREATTTSARSRNNATTQSSDQTTQAADPSSQSQHTQKSTTTTYNIDTSSSSS